AIANGWMPTSDQLILHRCHNRPCIRVGHLYCGTPQDNTDDMMEAGRHIPAKGESNGRALLTSQTAAEVKWLLINEPWRTLCEIGERYGISVSAVYHIKAGIVGSSEPNWIDVEPIQPPPWPRIAGFERRL